MGEDIQVKYNIWIDFLIGNLIHAFILGLLYRCCINRVIIYPVLSVLTSSILYLIVSLIIVVLVNKILLGKYISG